eukprot:7380067-Prymnesium_polylepis.2
MTSEASSEASSSPRQPEGEAPASGARAACKQRDTEPAAEYSELRGACPPGPRRQTPTRAATCAPRAAGRAPTARGQSGGGRAATVRARVQAVPRVSVAAVARRRGRREW